MEVSPGLYQRILHRVPKFIFSSVYDGSKGTLIIRVLEFSTARGGRAEESVSNRRIMDGQAFHSQPERGRFNSFPK